MPTEGTTTDRVKEMQKYDLEILSRTKTFREIGEMFGVAQNTVGTEVQRQLDNKTFYQNTLQDVEKYEEKLTVKEYNCGGGYGQWMNSDIRRFGIINRKTIENEST